MRLNIKPGDTYQRIDLLRALLVKSPNDVARCLARDNAGSIELFAQKMNAKARVHSVRPTRISSTPMVFPCQINIRPHADLSIIARAAYANPTIRSIVCLPQAGFPLCQRPDPPA